MHCAPSGDVPQPYLPSSRPEANVFHMRMLELPTKRTAPRGGGFVLSLASNARMSFSKALVIASAASSC